MSKRPAVASVAAAKSLVEDSSRPPESLASLLRSCASTSNAHVPHDIDDPASSAHAQLLSLTSQSLGDLRSQPAALITAKSALESQLSALCSRHVSSFVRVHTATSSLPSALDRLDEQLTMLIEDDLPTLSQAAQQFPEQIQAPMKAKDRARNLLDQYDLSLKDLLDIPRLLMTCARANHPIEALQLGTHMARIARSNISMGHRSTLLKALKQECWVHLIRLREDLLRGLGARGVRLPAARRYVSLLQRLHEVDEAGKTQDVASQKEDPDNAKLGISPSCVCLSFLRSRWILIEELGAHETDDDPITLLESQISTWRDIVGDSCTIALALFGDAASSGRDGTQHDELSPLSLIASFGYRAMSKLEQLISRSLPRLDGSTGSVQSAFEMLASLHTRLSYSAASLSRQGLDFSNVSEARLAFERQALQLWSKGLTNGIQAFEADMLRGSTLSVKELTGSVDARPLLSISLEQIQQSSDWSTEAARFPPAATLVNGILDAHEALLSFAPLSIGVEALKEFDVTVSDCVSQSLESFRKVEGDISVTDVDVQLEALHSGPSTASDTDKRRMHEATLAVSARLLTAICGAIVPAVRQLLLDTFESKQPMAPMLEGTIRDALTYCRDVDARWHSGEQQRRAEAEKQEQDRLALFAEEEARRVAEQKAHEEEKRQEATLVERARVEKETRRREAEVAAAAEAAAIEKHRREKEEEEALRLQQQQEEKARQQKLLEEQKRKEDEEEQERKIKAAEEAQRQKRQEEDKAKQLRAKEEAEAVERKKREQAEAEERKKKEKAEEDERQQEERAEAERKRAEVQEAHKERMRKEEAEAEAKRKQEEAEEEAEEEAKEEAEEEERKQKEEEDHAQAASEAEFGRDPKKTEGKEEKDAEKAAGQEANASNKQQKESIGEKVNETSVLDRAEDTTRDGASIALDVNPAVEAEKPLESVATEQDSAQTSAVQVSINATEPIAATAPSIRASKLAEKLRKRQEDRERAAAAKAKVNEE